MPAFKIWECCLLGEMGYKFCAIYNLSLYPIKWWNTFFVDFKTVQNGTVTVPYSVIHRNGLHHCDTALMTLSTNSHKNGLMTDAAQQLLHADRQMHFTSQVTRTDRISELYDIITSSCPVAIPSRLEVNGCKLAKMSCITKLVLKPSHQDGRQFLSDLCLIQGISGGNGDKYSQLMSDCPTRIQH